MAHFFDCIEEKVMQLLDTAKYLINEEIEQTEAKADDHQIILKIDEAVTLLRSRMNRSEDRCSTRDCIRKVSRVDTTGILRCKYH